MVPVDTQQGLKEGLSAPTPPGVLSAGDVRIFSAGSGSAHRLGRGTQTAAHVGIRLTVAPLRSSNPRKKHRLLARGICTTPAQGV